MKFIKIENPIRKWVEKLIVNKLDDLEGRVFKKDEDLGDYPLTAMTIASWYGDWSPITLEEEIDILQERLDALEKYLKVKTEKFEKEEGYRVVKIKKGKKPED